MLHDAAEAGQDGRPGRLDGLTEALAQNIAGESSRQIDEGRLQAIIQCGSTPTRWPLDTSALVTVLPRRSAPPQEPAPDGHERYFAYKPRIHYLKEQAAHDGYALNPASEKDFRDFLHSAPYISKGNLILMENGNLRAIWRDGQGTRMGLQFLGSGKLQYVIFKRRGGEDKISRASGRDNFDGIARQIDAFDLHSLLSE